MNVAAGAPVAGSGVDSQIAERSRAVGDGYFDHFFGDFQAIADVIAGAMPARGFRTARCVKHRTNYRLLRLRLIIW